jgi:hypothetical protein
MLVCFLTIFSILLLFNCKWFLPGGSGTTIRHNTQITHITQNNTPRSNKTQHAKRHKQGHTTHNEYNANTITSTTDTITTTII